MSRETLVHGALTEPAVQGPLGQTRTNGTDREESAEKKGALGATSDGARGAQYRVAPASRCAGTGDARGPPKREPPTAEPPDPASATFFSFSELLFFSIDLCFPFLASWACQLGQDVCYEVFLSSVLDYSVVS